MPSAADTSATDLLDVLIIGGGISGLAAAQRLLKQHPSLKVAVVEARGRVGGRLCSEAVAIPAPDSTTSATAIPGGVPDKKVGGSKQWKEVSIDVGGAYVGPTQDRLLRVAREHGVEHYPVHFRGTSVHYLHEKRAESDSYADCKLNKFEGEDFIPTNPLAMLDANRMLRVWDEMAKEIDCENPQACAKAKEWDGVTVAEWLRMNAWTDVTKSLGQLAVQSVLCKEPSEVSLLYWLTYVRSGQGIVRLISVDNGGQERKFVQGAAAIVERMAEKFVKDQKGVLLLGRPVLSILHREEFVEVSTACTSPHARSSSAMADTTGASSEPLTSSATLKAKQVILAVAPSLYGKIRFDPPLPPKKRKLSDSVSMGSIIKTNIFYDRPFWREYGFSGSVASMSGPVTYSIDDCGLNGEKCYSIMGFVLADHANHWAGKTRHERMMAIAKQYSEMLGIEELLRPVAYIEKDWSAEEFSGGCYVASMPCNVLTAYGDSLREAHAARGSEDRLQAPRVHFAGTELATKWIGYMDGAIEAGERAACDALKCLGVDACFEAEEAVDSVVKARPNDGEIIWWLPGVGQALAAGAVGLLAALCKAAVLLQQRRRRRG